ncbi:DUF6197 family protein [Streptomyces galilaeus]|uniref:DUF6197 family protein n=1 Tax=Streptomyces galilaeus TaxID=33899 RepID=UPI0038F65712
MTAAVLAPASPAVLDLDARLALTEAAMTLRLDQAAVAFEVNTAHLPAADPIPYIDAAPILPAPTCPHSSPVAAALHAALLRLEDGGWCAGAMRGEQRQTCLYGAVRATTSNPSLVDDAMAILLDVIRRDFPDAESVPAWNDRHGTARLAGRYLDRAAELAGARGL